jgi:serine/threonine protein kinase
MLIMMMIIIMMIDYININYDEYFIGMIEVLASKTKIFIVLELVNGGELFDRIVQVGKLKEEQARFYFQQLVEGVEYCHKLGKMIILHIYCCCSYCCRCCCCC